MLKKDFQTPLPEGCSVERGEFGDFVVCESHDIELDDIERKCESHGGKFHKGEFGPECIFEEERGGFFGGAQCQDDSFLREDANRCQADGGKPEKFRDDSGCVFVNCNYEKFEEKREKRLEKIEDRRERFYRQCADKNGRPTELRGELHCFTPEEKVRIKEELKQLEPTDILKIALKLENIVRALTEVRDNFEELRRFYDDRGDTEKAASFERAIHKIEGANDKLDEIRGEIADKVGDITEEDRVNVLRDIQQIKNIMQDIAIEILTGKPSDRAERREHEEEDDFMEKIRHCEEFSKDNPLTFQPDPEFDVTVYIDGENCVMNINSEETGELEFLLPPRAYQFFRDPEQLFKHGTECSPKDNCRKMRDMIRGEREVDRERDKEERRELKDDFDERRDELRDDFRNQRDDITGRAIDQMPRECQEQGLSPEECKRMFDERERELKEEFKEREDELKDDFKNRRDELRDNHEDYNDECERYFDDCEKKCYNNGDWDDNCIESCEDDFDVCAGYEDHDDFDDEYDDHDDEDDHDDFDDHDERGEF